MRKVMALVALTLTSLWFVSGIGGIAQATQPDPDHKVTICHRTNSVTNPYVLITVDEAAVNKDTGDDNGKGDHNAEHQGPVFDYQNPPPPPHNEDQWGDIIPPFYEDGSAGYWPSLNWDEAGQKIFEAGCSTPAPEVTAADPTFIDPDCDTEAGLLIPDVEGVIYSVEGTVAPGETVTVTAEAEEGFTLVGKSEWSHTYAEAPTDCENPPTEVVAAAPTFTDPDCDVKASLDIPETAHVSYAVVGEIAPGATVTVTATADEGYELKGRSEWSHTFGEKPKNCDTTPTPTPPPPTPPCTGPECHDLAETGFGAGKAAGIGAALLAMGLGSLFLARRRVV